VWSDTLDFEMVAVAVALAVAVAAGSSSELDVRWGLGSGFIAVASAEHHLAGDVRVRRTLEIRRHGVLLRRLGSTGDGLGVQVADITGDGVRDVLAFDYQGGTGVCGTYRLYGGPRFRELWVRAECADSGFVKLANRTLVLSKAVLASKTSVSNGSPHCCWRTWRRTAWRWDGGRLRQARSWLGSPPRPGYQERVLPGTFSPNR
jgi:hypothetical protein